MTAAQVVDRLRSVGSSVRRARDPRLAPTRPLWRQAAGILRHGYAVSCNICGWTGHDFEGPRHSERSTCRGCGSIARDRFLYQCWTSRTPYDRNAQVLETSPRLGDRYRKRMRSIVNYRCSDFDMRAHSADIQLDLQNIDLPDGSLDVVLTSHVLEHVPDPDKAIAELYRVVAPGGVMFVMVPLQQGRTAPPAEPEFHADDTPVFWRYGWDLTDALAAGGFQTTVLATGPFADALRVGQSQGPDYPEVDVESLLEHVGPYLDRIAAVTTDHETTRLGLECGSMLVGWEARRPIA